MSNPKVTGAVGELARERVRMAPWAYVALAAFVVQGLYLASLGHALANLLFILAFVALFATLRTQVTPTHVRVKLAVFGPEIPIARVTAAEAIDGYSFFSLGWGIRFSPWENTITYSVPAFGRRYLRIAYTDEKGRPRIVRAMSQDPDTLVQAIEAAKAALPTRS